MYYSSSILWLIFGGLIGHIFPRIPILFFTRSKSHNEMFPPHPESVPITPELLNRILNLRRLYWMSIFFTIPSLIYGWIMIANLLRRISMKNTISDETWNKLEMHYSPIQLIDLVISITSTRMVSAAVNSFGVELESGWEAFSVL